MHEVFLPSFYYYFHQSTDEERQKKSVELGLSLSPRQPGSRGRRKEEGAMMKWARKVER